MTVGVAFTPDAVTEYPSTLRFGMYSPEEKLTAVAFALAVCVWSVAAAILWSIKLERLEAEPEVEETCDFETSDEDVSVVGL